ncbi:hypothetical protein PSV08DRAFT_19517 [Bipolaris maydis]|uniref:uncharacterized protein n=1 Tax=Cochliobolus heterostrophus TaxID=5016 RepID=UPI0024D95903|nr:hypothetical protein J3E73DRAFT_19697 [Bipolaris maydis]KAJ6265684.1 hypothetical protein PSV08DRAFT_19517 [Bipolaris maydis]KAJ6276945.1 hypothetical protein J3E71DRAFT_20204 [Bipolaris maydis]
MCSDPREATHGLHTLCLAAVQAGCQATKISAGLGPTALLGDPWAGSCRSVVPETWQWQSARHGDVARRSRGSVGCCSLVGSSVVVFGIRRFSAATHLPIQGNSSNLCSVCGATLLSSCLRLAQTRITRAADGCGHRKSGKLGRIALPGSVPIRRSEKLKREARRKKKTTPTLSHPATPMEDSRNVPLLISRLLRSFHAISRSTSSPSGRH